MYHGIIIYINYSGLNFDDLIARQGLSKDFKNPPFITGFECSGYIEDIGRGVEMFKKGDRVLCFQNLGCAAKFITVSSRYVYLIPEQMSIQVASGIFNIIISNSNKLYNSIYIIISSCSYKRRWYNINSYGFRWCWNCIITVM